MNLKDVAYYAARFNHINIIREFYRQGVNITLKTFVPELNKELSPYDIAKILGFKTIVQFYDELQAKNEIHPLTYNNWPANRNKLATPSSYPCILIKKSEPEYLKKIRAILKDYTKGNALNRYIHFHSGRNHIKEVEDILQKLD